MPIIKTNTNASPIGGYLNLKVVQDDNTEQKLPKGIALRLNNRVEGAINDIMKANPDGVLVLHATWNPVLDAPVELKLFTKPVVDASEAAVVNPDIGGENS